MRGVRMPSPAMIVALIALACSLAGGAYAALKLKPNSVRSKQIARNAVKSPDIAPNAAKGVDVNEATLEGVNAASAANADKLDGLDSTALVRSFAGHISDIVPDQVFEVPEMDVAILGDTSFASSAFWRVRNDSTTGTVTVSNFETLIDSVFTVAPNTISGNKGGDPEEVAPLVLTSSAHPDLMLIFGCAEGTGGAYCFGQLMEAPPG